VNLFNSAWDIISPLLTWVIGLCLVMQLGPRLGSSSRRSLHLYIWHTIWCLAYVLYSLGNSADSVSYYQSAKTGAPAFQWGTSFVEYLTYFLISFLDLSYLSCFLVFNAIGSIGYISFDGTIRELNFSKRLFARHLVSLVIFLPSISFWSSAIGKDAIAFTACILALRASLKLASRWPLGVLAIALMLLVRPHMGALLLISMLIDVLSSKKLPILKKLGLFLLVGIASISILPLVIQQIGLVDGVFADSVSIYIEQRQSYNQEGGGGVDISGLPLPLQLGTYLFRPFFFDVNSALALAASFENLTLVCLFCGAVINILKGQRIPQGTPTLFLGFYALASWLILAVTTANLGIALRQKWMFLPFLIYLSVALAPNRIKLADSSQI